MIRSREMMRVRSNSIDAIATIGVRAIRVRVLMLLCCLIHFAAGDGLIGDAASDTACIVEQSADIALGAEIAGVVSRIARLGIRALGSGAVNIYPLIVHVA